MSSTTLGLIKKNLQKEISYDDAYTLLREADPVNAINTLPMCPDGGTLWLFPDNGDSKQAKDYVYDGYLMPLDKRRTYPPHEPYIEHERYFAYTKDKKRDNRFKKIVFQLHKDCTVVEEALVNGHTHRIPLLSLVFCLGNTKLPLRAPNNKNNKKHFINYSRSKSSTIISAKTLLA
ncbi:unnamed protein product [Didymodactylos carnosus]|uniref:Uncharacterized protein n=1 Tax=Didymodactylos carnosus TaxID=1234261 RepID=A0A815XW90_9BILA|nr:unnamed protein product [Didymodactylos carnosus]CAF1562603.1 unnamed protein product [Didymodactylos carnosus]CAF3915882.1 unnamed protein product [Didymodactylos carnosus]CAF4424207.1 unnamed protein product [Didymodactylos carnosus]